MGENPKTFTVKEVEDLKKLEDFDGLIREYHLSLDDPVFAALDQLIGLVGKLAIALPGIHEGYETVHKSGSYMQMLLGYSVCGCLRTLRVCRKLALEGYTAEMHAVARIVTEWCECALVASLVPEVAERVFKKGSISKKDKTLARRHSKEADKLFELIAHTCSTFSKTAHVTPTTFRLMTKEVGDGVAVHAGGIANAEIFRQNAHVLATMAANALSVFSAHYRRLPDEWRDEFESCKERIGFRNILRT